MTDPQQESPNIDFEFMRLSNTHVRVKVMQGPAIVFMDRVDPSSDRSRTRLINKLAERKIEINEEELHRALMVDAVALLEADVEAPEPSKSNQQLLAEMDPSVVADAVKLAKGELLNADGEVYDIIEYVLEAKELLGHVGDDNLFVTLFLACCSRPLARPFGVLVMGSSACGKSFTQDTVVSLFPEEVVLEFTSYSPATFAHLGDVKHLIISVGEMSQRPSDGQIDGDRFLRELLTRGKAVRKIVTLNPKGGPPTVVDIVVEGPIVLLQSTTMSPNDMFDENMNRVVMAYVDESQEQTVRIIKSNLRRELGMQSEINAEGERRRQVLHALHRLLPTDVAFQASENLYEDAIAKLPTENAEVRRALGIVASATKAVTWLFQFQRERTVQQQLLITPEDADIAAEFVFSCIEPALRSQITKGAADFLQWVTNWRPETPFTSVEAFVAKSNLGKPTVYRYLKELYESGYLEMVSRAGRGGERKYRLKGREE